MMSSMLFEYNMRDIDNLSLSLYIDKMTSCDILVSVNSNQGNQMNSVISINLRRLRSIKGKTQDEIAAAAGISRVAYRNIETGSSVPRSGTLDAIAGALGVDILALATPVPQPTTLRFRAHKGLSAQERAERTQLVTDTLNWLTDFKELENMLDDRISSVLTSKSRANSDIATLAEEVRREDFHVECSDCLPDICDILEAGGVKVRVLQSNIKGFSGFSVGKADGGPAVVVNTLSTIPVERRIFTAAHELGHLILHRNSFDPTVETEDSNEEHEADIFASYFLMPSKQFQDEWSRNRGLHWVDRVLKTKRAFRVSWMTVLFRLCELKQADRKKIFWQFSSAYKSRFGKELSYKHEPDSQATTMAATQPSQEPDRLTEYDFYEDRFDRLVRKALEKDEISVSRAAEMLAISVKEMQELVLEWREHE